jgi:bacteriorhodopsin
MHIAPEKWMHATFFGILLCAWASLWLIGRMWLIHRHDPILKRVIWTLILLIPFFGWLAYGAFYTPLNENEVKASANADVMSGGY